jgi:hypothetical protein
MKYPKVYEKIRQNMADEFDTPDTDEIIAAALDAAREAVEALFPPLFPSDDYLTTKGAALAAIDALKDEQ